jgi:Trypsin
MRFILTLLSCHLVAAFDPRIIGGPDADIDRFPYMAAVYELKTYDFFCSGSIIHVNWILTAGHCWHKPKTVGVRVGSSFLARGGQTYKASKFIVHERYEPKKSNGFDIALLQTTEAIKRSSTVQTVKLPKPDAYFKVGTGCMASGYGKTEVAALDARERRLRYLGMPILPQFSCKRMRRYTAETMICVGFLDTKAGLGGVRVIENVVKLSSYLQCVFTGRFGWSFGL